jgi:ubiquinone biosynthesis protein
VLDELDLMREAANASQLKRNFAGSPLLYVPEIYWDYCRTDVLVMERIHGIPIGDIAQLRDAKIDFKRLSENGVEIFFTQVFSAQFLPCRYASGKHLRAGRQSGPSALRRS